MEVVLVGNPNTGKTTLFNSLTKSSEHTGNWHGVTVEDKKKKYIYENQEYVVTDLPGIYSLSPLSFEEKVSCDYLINRNNFLVINILDINTIYKNFYLTYELLQLNSNMIIVINKTSKMHRRVYNVNVKKMQEILGVCVVEIDAKNKHDVELLKQKIAINNFNKNNKNYLKFCKNDEKIEFLMQNARKKLNFSSVVSDFYLRKCLTGDENIIKKMHFSEENLNVLNSIQNEVKVEDIYKSDYINIKEILKRCGVKKYNKVHGRSKLDKFVLNKYLCFPIFCLTMICVFYLTFFSVGKSLSNVFSDFINNVLGEGILKVVQNVTSNKIIYDFFETAIIGGIGSIFAFLPQVVILFVCLAVLEDSGYLSRIAFCLDGVFSKIGLSGKSVYTLLMGFGCSALSCMSARVMDDRNSQMKTAMLAPYMSCSAKLPIYTVIGSAFFGAGNVFVVFAMYMLGVVVALILSVVLEKKLLKTKESSFIFEMPSLKMVEWKKLLCVAKDNSKQFVVRIGSLLASVNIIVWVMSNFSFSLRFVGMGGSSILEVIGKCLAPIFAPLGFGNWGAVSALVSGLIAKELVVSSIAMLNGVSSGVGTNLNIIASSITNPSSIVFFTPSGAISYMVFCLLYCPCISTIAVLKKEIGKKWTFISVIVQFLVAYLISYIVFNITNVVMQKGLVFLFIYLSVALLLMVSVWLLFKYLFKKKCVGCSMCKARKKHKL